MSGWDDPGMTDVMHRQSGKAGRFRLVAAAVVIGLLVVEAVVFAPTIESAVESLSNADVTWFSVAVLAIAASMGMFALTRRRLLLAAGVHASVGSSVAAALVANSLHATLPGGPAFSTAYTFRWMRGEGAGNAVATWCLVAGGLVSTASLGLVGLGATLSVGGSPSWTQVVLSAAGLVVVTAIAREFVRRPQPLVTAAGWALRRVNRLRRRPEDTGVTALDELVAQLGTVRPRGRDWSAATGLALLNWAFDAACLAACAAALGVHGLTLPLLLLVYTAGMTTSGLSPLPGGLGVVDAALVLTLVAGGIPAAQALPVVVLYRLLSLVGVVAAGWLVCAVQQFGPARGRQALKGETGIAGIPSA
ncbi:YbhN family protein [Umezawaea endophytica]|uniref:YbhN family protein n=1 Tax=Umezawaea endophytica TaxID=1654476 RepID=A0A9X2VKX6_9PSEU|nr:YbhN family protein [Umezawaea endophytica]MCS7478536.1 YbhN family protein [Umezawaea endophytica]